MSERVYRAVGLSLGFAIAIVAVVSFANRGSWDTWWLPIAIAGLLTGAWWTVGGVFLRQDDGRR